MKHFFSALVVVFFATSLMAQTGLTCDDPILVGQDFRGTAQADTELWYTAWSYDLPLHVYFSPESENSDWGPEVTIDFTCTPGEYDDPKLDSVVNQLSGFGLSLPVEFLCDKIYRNGKVEWDLVIDQSYRERLTEVGITYNVQAFVKVYFPEAGEIRMTPDTSFQSCVENGYYVRLGDTIDIAANDEESVFVLPYSEWKNDSIQFTWIGEQSARVWVAKNECKFTPITTSAYYITHYDIAEGAPHKLQAKEIESFMETHKFGGIYFGKVVSKGPGKLVVERIPLGEIQGDAVLLKHGESVQLQANDNRVFCFPKTWKSTEFLANTQYLMAMHVSNTPEFEIGDANVISKYAFSKEGNTRELELSSGDITALAASATDDYLYVRFECNSAVQLTPTSWNPASCGNQSVVIKSGEEVVLKTASTSDIYRLRYADWVGYDFSIQWKSYGQLSLFVADACDIMLSGADPHVIWSKTFNPNNTVTITAAELEEWSSQVDADGFLYVRVSPKMTGRVTFTSAKPAETDPEGPVLDPVHTTESATICFGETYPWNGKEYNATGEYTYTTVAANGADSIVTLNLTVLPEVPVTEEVAAICFGETYTWQGQEYTESGEYSVTYQDVNGCDSVVSLNLTVHPKTEATTEEVTIDFGASYEWNGKTYTESGPYTITLQDKNGCDYEATLVLTVKPEEKPENPCVAVSTLLEPVATLTLNLGDAFDIYRIDYQAWLASGVNLVWTGKGALHTFVAKHCEFAVAVYHKEVVNYTEVPAEGNVILSKAILAPLAQYVDADGYLYVRFLTEQEGQLTTAIAE